MKLLAALAALAVWPSALIAGGLMSTGGELGGLVAIWGVVGFIANMTLWAWPTHLAWRRPDRQWLFVLGACLSQVLFVGAYGVALKLDWSGDVAFWSASAAFLVVTLGTGLALTDRRISPLGG